jgi:hypothetical protein
VRLSVRPFAALSLCAIALAGCGDTLQDQPIPHNILEGLIASPYPVYWLGGSFQHLAITEAAHDPSGSFSIQYGNCVEGGQGTCVPPLRVVSSPDNSFLPGGHTSRLTVRIRGVAAVVAQGGDTIVLATGGIVVDIYAENPRLARAAAATAVPINEAGAPEAPLPAPLPNTGFTDTPLPAQMPSPLHALR